MKANLLGLAAGAAYAGMVLLGDLRGSQTGVFLALFWAACVPYALAVRHIRQGRELSLLAVWLFAVVFRAILLLSPPTLSDDVYRYVWDGRVQSAAVNPYAYRVAAPELDGLATPNRARVNHPEMASPYLPAAQVYFAAAYRLAPENVTVFQAGAAAFDLAAGLFLMLALRAAGLPAAAALVYLWNPLVVVESAHGAHVDALMVALMLAALWAAGREQRAASAVLLALATLVKPVPALLLAVLAWRWGWRPLALYLAVVAGGIALYAGAGLGLGAAETGTGVFGAMRLYAAHWHFNNPWFLGLNLLFPGARLIAPALLAAALVAIALAARRDSSAAPAKQAIPPLAAYVLLSPTLHPWYLLPLIAVLAFRLDGPWRRVFAWLYFSAAVALSYLYYAGPLTLPALALGLAAQYVPLYALLLWPLSRESAGDRRIAA